MSLTRRSFLKALSGLSLQLVAPTAAVAYANSTETLPAKVASFREGCWHTIAIVYDHGETKFLFDGSEVDAVEGLEFYVVGNTIHLKSVHSGSTVLQLNTSLIKESFTFSSWIKVTGRKTLASDIALT